MVDECQYFVYAAGAVRRKMTKEYTREHPEGGLTAAENLLLEAVAVNPGITFTELGKKLDYNKSLVTKNMKAPLEGGYLTVRDIDGRTSAINVTPKGMELVKIGRIKREMFVDAVFENCSPEERQTFMTILHKLKLD